MCVLLTGVSGAWGETKTLTIIDNASGGKWSGGSYSNDNGASNWKSSWTSTLINVTKTTQICITASDYVLNKDNGQIGSSTSKSATFTISAMGEFKITGYDIKFKNVNTNGSNNQTITPSAGGDPATAEGASEATVNVTGLTAKSATFTLSGNNELAKITYFKIYYEADSYSGGTWSSGVSDDDIAAHYSTVWYVKLKSPFFWDVFFDSFELTHRSDGSSDYDGNTYLAFTYNTFTEQNNHKANEFIAISTNYSDRKGSGVKNKVIYSFSEKVRLNGGETVYACFVSKNVDGTYNLQKRGLGVKSTSSNGTLFMISNNDYTTAETKVKNYQCHYTCDYTISYDIPSTRLWSGMINKDKTYGGWIEIAYMKYTSPGSSGDYIHFDQFSMSLRDGSVVANTYLLFSTECLTGTGVSESTEFEPGRFTAISTNCVPSANYGKVFTFTFDSESYLPCGKTYYIYMGIKQNGKYRLRKYGIFINHQTTSSGFAYSSALATAAATPNDAWQAIYYSNTYTAANLNTILNAFYTPVKSLQAKLGTELGQYSHPDYTTEQINTALSSAETASAGSDASAKETSISTLRSINESLALNLPATNGFYRFNIGDNYMCNVADGDNVRSVTETNNDKSTIFYLDENNYLIDYAEGYGFNYGYCKATSTGIFNSFDFSESTTLGKYYIHSNPGTGDATYSNRYITISGSKLKQGQGEWSISKVTSLPVTFYGEYASFYSPVDLTLPSGVKAYTGKLNGDNTKLTLSEVDYVPANTGVILEYAEFSSEPSKDFPILSTVTPVAETSLRGTVAAQSATAGTKLVLGKEDENWGIYAYGSEGTVTLNGFKAYMDMPAGGGSVKGFKFSFDDETAIEALTSALQSTDCTIYNLAGQRINRLQRGVNIVNGKKVLVK